MQSAMRATLYRFDRRSERLPINRASTLRGPDRLPVDIRIEDLSVMGCRLSTTVPLDTNEPVMVGLPGVGIRAGRIIWTKEDQLGCAFETPLSRGDVETIRISSPLTPVDFRPCPSPPSAPARSADDAHPSTRQRLGYILIAAMGAWGLTLAVTVSALFLVTPTR